MLVPNLNQHADAAMSVIEDEDWHRRQQTAREIIEHRAQVEGWPEQELADVLMSLGLVATPPAPRKRS